MKVDFTKLNSANVTADNSVDEAKKYDITARVNISENKVNSVDSGRVVKEGVEVASFSKWGENQLNVNFNGVDVMEMCSILTEVNSFYNNVVEKVENEPINI
jgi:hypothetical protein